MKFKLWVHHLFNPHCTLCELERECKNCNMLRQMLTEERFEKKRLLDNLLAASRPSVIGTAEQPEPLPANSFVPFRVRRAMLEEQKRAEAVILKELENNTPKDISDIDKLEREVGVHAS